MNSQTKLFTNTKGHARTDAAVHLAHDLIDRAAQHLGGSEEKLRQNAQVAEQAVRKSLQTVRARSVNASTRAQSVFARHPIAALGIALGSGALFSLWLSRRPPATEVETPATDSE